MEQSEQVCRALPYLGHWPHKFQELAEDYLLVLLFGMGHNSTHLVGYRVGEIRRAE